MMRSILLLGVMAVFANGQAAKTAWTDMAARQGQVADLLKRSAAKMPEASWDFKPTHEVNSFAAFIGHLADASYAICAGSMGEKSPSPGVAKTMKGKDELSKGLGEALAYCDKAYAALNNENANEPVKLFGMDMTRAGALGLNTAHSMEHYGNLVTYMRIRGLVPPSSEKR